MGAIQSNNNKVFSDWSKEDVAGAVTSFGAKYAVYAAAICENGMDGAFFVSLEGNEETFMETLDDLEITNRLHRRKLLNEFTKATTIKTTTSSNNSVTSSVRISVVSQSNSNRSLKSLRESLRSGGSVSACGSSNRSISSKDDSDSDDDDDAASGYLSAGSSHAASFLSAIETENEKMRISLEALSSELILQAQQGQQQGRQSRPRKGMTPPTDHGTIVLTDIEGSTALWENNPTAMHKALALHDQIMRRLIAEHYGYEVTTEGDAFVICFHEAADALNFCLSMQRTMSSAPWEEDILELPWCLNNTTASAADCARRGPQVRTSVHMGHLKTIKDACTDRVSYTGDAMEIAKSLEQCAFGGQILTSQETYQAAMATGALDQSSTQMVLLGTHAVTQKKVNTTNSKTGRKSSTKDEPPQIIEVVEIAPVGMTLMNKMRQDTSSTNGSNVPSEISWSLTGLLLGSTRGN